MSATGNRSFTLMELMAVLAIVAVLGLLVVPLYADSLWAAQWRETARRLQVVTRYLHSYALTHQCVCRVRVLAEKNQYLLERQDDSPDSAGGFVPLPGPMRSETLGQGVKLSVKVDPGLGRDAAGPEIWFYPDGQADAAVIEVTNGKRLMSLVIQSSTGRTILMEGAARQLPNDRRDLDAES